MLIMHFFIEVKNGDFHYEMCRWSCLSSSPWVWGLLVLLLFKWNNMSIRLMNKRVNVQFVQVIVEDWLDMWSQMEQIYTIQLVTNISTQLIYTYNSFRSKLLNQCFFTHVMSLFHNCLQLRPSWYSKYVRINKI